MSMQENLDNAHITALTDLINQAVQDVITEYAAVGQAVPSLDTLDPGPFKQPEDMPPRLTRAIKVIEAACTQLSCTVAYPGAVVFGKSLEHQESACLRVATEARIADILLDKPNGLPASDIAGQTGIDEGKLTRILRFLSTKHCFKEVKHNVFANNRLSIKLLSPDAISAAVEFGSDEVLKGSGYLYDTLRKNPSASNEQIAFKRATGFALFDYYKTAEGIHQGERFTQTMMGIGRVFGKASLAKAFPWDTQPTDATICDVGGGNGHLCMELMKVHPHLKVVLQDEQDVIEWAQKFWTQEHPIAVANERIRFVPFDFFKDAAVEGCDFYYLCAVLHDWPDTQAELILKNVRKAMKPSSRVILHDIVLRDAAQNDSFQVSDAHGNLNHDVAPKPLLPNYGAGRIRPYHFDVMMMSVFNGKERTLDELVDLGQKCGLRFEKIYEAGELNLVEFRPV